MRFWLCRHTGEAVAMQEGRDHWYHDIADVSGDCPCEPMNAEDPLFILYTLGFDRQPEGCAAHHRRLFGLDRERHFHYVFRLPPRRSFLLLGRYRLGHGAQLMSSTDRCKMARPA